MSPESIIAFALIFGIAGIFVLWINRDSGRWLKQKETPMLETPALEFNESRWQELLATAEHTVRRTIAELPPELKAEAVKLPCLLKWAEADADDETLGRYLGFESGVRSEYNGPIVLFLGSIQRYCEEDGLDFAEEVRTTYLHEFGHHLGWDEDEMEERGLG